MSSHTSYQVIFGFCLALAVISFIISLFVKVPVIETPIKATERKKLKFSDFVEPSALPIALIVIIVSLGYSSVLSFINFYAIEINLVDVASFFSLSMQQLS